MIFPWTTRMRTALWRRVYRDTPFAAGQLWRFEHRTDPDARLLIQRVTSEPGYGDLFYVVPFTPWLPILTASQRDYAVFPLTGPVLRRSVTRLLAAGLDPLDVNDQIAEFEAWLRADETSAFDRLSLGDQLTIYRELYDRQPHNHPGAYYSFPDPLATK